MPFVKLQLGCLLVIAYIEITYILATLRGKIPCNRFFDALLVVSPWAVFFDAVSQRRCYRDALPLKECFSIIEKGSSVDFDPDIVRIFLNSKEEIVELMQTHNEED